MTLLTLWPMTVKAAALYVAQYHRPVGPKVRCDSFDWEHVSVSLRHRCPTWDEMCFVKNLFWEEDECVIQFHPPKAEYVNYHPYCLHLWKPTIGAIATPPPMLVGPGPR